MSAPRSRLVPPWSPIAAPISRRAFLAGSVDVALVGLLAACSPSPVPSPSPSPVPSSSPTAPPPTGSFDALDELRAAVRGSPDHLAARAQGLVAAQDAEGLLSLVRDAIDTYPAGARSSGDPVRGRRWGTRATLRGRAGTPREKADLLTDLYRQAGLTAEVVQTDAPGLDPGLIFRHAPRPPFDPSIDDGRLAALRSVLGLPAAPTVPTAVDTDGAASAALADALLAGFDPPPQATAPFDARPLQALPLVRVTVAGEERYADPIGSAGLEPAGDRAFRRAGAADDLLPVIVRVEAARSDAPDRALTLVEGRWTADDLVGRTLFVGFSPPVESLEELVAIRPRDVSTFLPVLAVRGPGLPADETHRLSVSGTAVTLGGELVDVDAPDGITRVGDRPIGPARPDPARVALVRSLEVSATGAAFPVVGVGLRALAADGTTVEGLPAAAFAVSDEGTGVGFLLERALAPPPRILVLLDDSSSIPDAFRGAGAATIARRIAERLVATDPRTQLRVAKVDVGRANPAGDWTSDPAEVEGQVTAKTGYGSQLWEALVSAARLGPTAIVLVTDGAATDGEAEIAVPPVGLPAQVRLGPPAVLIGVGDIRGPMLGLLGEAGRIGAFPVTAQDEAVDTVVAMLARTPAESYRMRYNAPPDGPAARRVEVRLSGTAIVGSATYEIPAATDRAMPPALSALFLVVRVGSTEVRRLLAGVAADGPRTPVTRLDVERVRRTMFGSYVLSFEAAAPPLSVLLDDAFTALLSLRPLLEAKDRAARLAALAGGPYLVPGSLFATTVRLPEAGGDALTYESGLRVTLHRDERQPTGEGRVRRVRAVDILPHAGFTTVDPNATAAFRSTARRTARLALAEAAVFPNSTFSALEGERLVPLGSSVHDALAGVEPGLIDAMAAAVEPWRRLRPLGLLPADGTPSAAWLFDRQAGGLYGVLADGSGGGSETEEIEDTFDRAGNLLDGAALGSDIASILGLGGLSFAGGVWLQLEKTKLQKLKAATLMLATLEAPEGDIADLSDLGCGLAQSVAFEGLGRMAGRFAGELGARAVTGVSIADGATSMATGSGFFC